MSNIGQPTNLPQQAFQVGTPYKTILVAENGTVTSDNLTGIFTVFNPSSTTIARVQYYTDSAVSGDIGKTIPPLCAETFAKYEGKTLKVNRGSVELTTYV